MLTNYDKIKQFVQENYQEMSVNDVLIRQVSEKRYQVGNWCVQDVEDKWQVSNPAGSCNAALLQPRLAILMAVLVQRNKFKQARAINNLDQGYNISSNDYNFYLYKTKIDPENPVYQDRLDNAKRTLEKLRGEINEVEKTVNLQ